MTQNFTRKQKFKIIGTQKKNENKGPMISAKKNKNIFFPKQSIVSRIGVKLLTKTPKQKKKEKFLEEKSVSFYQQQDKKPQRNQFLKRNVEKPIKKNALIETYRRNKENISFWRRNIKIIQYQTRAGDKAVQQLSAFALFKKKSMIKNKKKKTKLRSRTKAKLKLQSKLSGAVVKSFHFGKNVYSQYFRLQKLKQTQHHSVNKFKKSA